MMKQATKAKASKTKAPTHKWGDVRARWMKDPALVKEYNRIAPAMELAFALAEARASAGLTQAQIARKMKTSQSAVARLERGGVKPSFAMAQRYARALGKRLVIELVAAE